MRKACGIFPKPGCVWSHYLWPFMAIFHHFQLLWSFGGISGHFGPFLDRFSHNLLCRAILQLKRSQKAKQPNRKQAKKWPIMAKMSKYDQKWPKMVQKWMTVAEKKAKGDKTVRKGPKLPEKWRHKEAMNMKYVGWVNKCRWNQFFLPVGPGGDLEKCHNFVLRHWGMLWAVVDTLSDLT